MSKLFYIIALVLVIAWAIGFFGLKAGEMIHFLLIFAAVAVLFGVSKVKEAI